MVRRTLAAIAILFAVAGASALAQQDQAGKTQAFTVDGINVIISPADNELVSVIFGLEGGLASGETSNPALAEFAADVMLSGGSKEWPKDALRKFSSQTSTQFNAGGDYRGINYSMTATLSNFNKAWDVLTSLILHPLYDEISFRNIRQQREVGARDRWSQSEAFSSIIADSLVKLGNPVLSQWARLEDVDAVTIPAIIDFHNKIAERSRMLVVIVGKVDPQEIKQKLKAFSSLPMGSYRPAKIPGLITPAAPSVQVVDRPQSPTTYVTASFVGPVVTDRDYWPLYIGMTHLRSVLFEEVRTKRNLSYAPQSWVASTMGNGIGKMSVSSVLPDSAMSVMLRELAKMREGKFTDEDLDNSKQVFITSFYMSRMTNAARAQAMYSFQRNAGDWRRAFAYDEINAVDKPSVERAFRKYAHDLQVGIVGTEAKVTNNKYLYGK